MLFKSKGKKIMQYTWLFNKNETCTINAKAFPKQIPFSKNKIRRVAERLKIFDLRKFGYY